MEHPWLILIIHSVLHTAFLVLSATLSISITTSILQMKTLKLRVSYQHEGDYNPHMASPFSPSSGGSSTWKTHAGGPLQGLSHTTWHDTQPAGGFPGNFLSASPERPFHPQSCPLGGTCTAHTGAVLWVLTEFK